MEPRFPALQADSLPAEPQVKPHIIQQGLKSRGFPPFSCMFTPWSNFWKIGENAHPPPVGVPAREKTLWGFPSMFPIYQFSSVAQSCPTLYDPMNCSTPGLPVHHHLPEFTQTHVHRVGDAIQPSHPRSSPSPPALNPSQHQSFLVSQLFAWGGQSTGVSYICKLGYS